MTTRTEAEWAALQGEVWQAMRDNESAGKPAVEMLRDASGNLVISVGGEVVMGQNEKQ